MTSCTAAPWRQNPRELERESVLMSLVPTGDSVLDIGARDGHYSRLLAERYDQVTALDLVTPEINHPRIRCVAGDLMHLDFPNRSFDCVFCAEVLEHIPDVERAASEMSRVARESVVVGVPLEQDLRFERCRCSCGRRSPAFGHVHSFTQERLFALLPNLVPTEVKFAGSSKSRTNWLSVLLMDLAGNPDGSYDQAEPCIYCGKPMHRPRIGRARRILASASARLVSLQHCFSAARPIWIQVRFTVS